MIDALQSTINSFNEERVTLLERHMYVESKWEKLTEQEKCRHEEYAKVKKQLEEDEKRRKSLHDKSMLLPAPSESRREPRIWRCGWTDLTVKEVAATPCNPGGACMVAAKDSPGKDAVGEGDCNNAMVDLVSLVVIGGT